MKSASYSYVGQRSSVTHRSMGSMSMGMHEHRDADRDATGMHKHRDADRDAERDAHTEGS